MLVGSFKYNNYIYGVKAYDFGDYISVYLNPTTPKGKFFLDKGVPLDDEGNYQIPRWEELFVSVGMGFVKCDCYTGTISTSNGEVNVKNAVNVKLLQAFANILRGMKSGCSRNNEMNDDLFNIGFNPHKITKYEYENGYISLKLKIIHELKYTNHAKGISLELEEDGSYETKIWSDSNVKHKFKLDLSEFLKVTVDDDWSFDDGDDKIFSLQEIIERNPDKQYVWLKGRKYHIIKTIEEVEIICKKIWKHKGLVAFDTETTGLKINVTSRVGLADRLVGMVFSITPGEAYYFPIAHKKIKNICTPGNEQFIIEKYFKPILEQKQLLCHNGSYDWKVMYIYGICCNIVHDTYILFKVTLWNDHRNLALSLKKLTSVFLNRDSFELSDFVRGKFGENVQFWDLEEESVKYYACPDTDNLIELFEYAVNERLLEKYEAKKIYEIEVLFSIVIAYQEFYGHCVDVDNLDALNEAIKRDKEENYKFMTDMVGHDFNPKSNKDLPKVCFEELGLPVIGLTDAGNPSTGKDTRKAWLKSTSLSNEKKAFVRALGKYLDARTLESNFTKNISKFATEDGLMFSEVSQFLETGRVSTSDPNYQGYSDVVKHYIPPRMGYYGIDADYSSVEARIMCSMAGCGVMVKKMSDPDTDYHRQKASDMFQIPYELVTDELRKMSKGVNFGILYGLGDPNLGENLRGVKSPENTKYAKRMKKLYFKGMEELESFIDESKMQGTKYHYSKTFFKRRRYYDERITRKDTIERRSCNARIQGTAADLYKLAMVRLFLKIKENGWLGKVLISAFVHDECFLEVHKSIDPCVMLKVLRECMMIDIEGWCPLFIGAGFGRNWYEAKHTEIPVQVQDYMVNTFGETGLDWWDGDTEKLCNWSVKCIENYKRDRVINFMKNEENWGKALKPTENELAHSILKDISKGQKVEGAITDECTPSDDMLENLKEFSRVFDCMDLFEKANIQKPTQVKTNNTEVEEDEESISDAEQYSKNDIILMRLNVLGTHMAKTAEGKKLYFKYDANDKAFMNIIYGVVTKESGDIEVIAVDSTGQQYTTGISTSAKAYPAILQLYVNHANMRR